MNSWFAKHIGDGMWAPIVCAEIEEKFQPLFESAGKPAGMTVFVRREEGSLHCEVIAYFSPRREMWRKYSMQRGAPNRHAKDWNYWREMKTAGRCCFEILYREIYLAVGLILFPFQPKKIMLFSTCPL